MKRTATGVGKDHRVECAAAMLLISLLSIGGCRKEEPARDGGAATSPSAAKTIGVSLLTMQHQFYQELRAGLESAADKSGFRLVVVSAEFDSSRQANQIDEFLVQKVDAIVVCPCDSRSVGASIAAANRANIPVFTADIANNSSIGKVMSHIASDNVQGGREAAKLLATAMGNSGKVAILSHPEVASVTDRVRGFKEQLATHPKIQIVAELSAEGKRDKAVRVMEDLLQSHPDLSGVFGINDDTILGALAAIEAAGKVGKIQIVGYDATPEARAKIAARAVFGDVIQHPRRIGELTIQAIGEYFAGRPPAPTVQVEVGTYTGSTP
jgi:ribose transport system substrate-binding protein